MNDSRTTCVKIASHSLPLKAAQLWLCAGKYGLQFVTQINTQCAPHAKPSLNRWATWATRGHLGQTSLAMTGVATAQEVANES